MHFVLIRAGHQSTRQIVSRRLIRGTGEITARITSATDEDYERIINNAITAQEKWRMVPAPQRGKLVARIGELMRENLEDLGAIVSIDTGKSLMEGKGEVNESIDMAMLAAGQSRMLYGFSQQSQRARHRMYDQWQPLGVAGIISAYNFPAAVWAQNGFLSAICGNTVIWRTKPEGTTHSDCDPTFDQPGHDRNRS